MAKSTADEIEEMNREALRRLAVFNAAMTEHVIKPLTDKIVDDAQKLMVKKDG